jgi:hypothetical protein
MKLENIIGTILFDQGQIISKKITIDDQNKCIIDCMAHQSKQHKIHSLLAALICSAIIDRFRMLIIHVTKPEGFG